MTQNFIKTLEKPDIKEATIQGHFLICYTAVLLERLFQYGLLNDQYSASEIFRFMRNFRVTKGAYSYINRSTDSPLLQKLEQDFKLPLRNDFLPEPQIQKILNLKLKNKKSEPEG